MADAKNLRAFAPFTQRQNAPRQYILRTFGLAERTRAKRQYAPAH